MIKIPLKSVYKHINFLIKDRYHRKKFKKKRSASPNIRTKNEPNFYGFKKPLSPFNWNATNIFVGDSFSSI